MGRVTCYEAVKIVIDEATSQFAPGLIPSEFKLYQLRVVCGQIDSLAGQFNGVSYETEIDDETCDISITLVCGLILVQEFSHPFINVADRSKSIQISGMPGGENIAIRFTFPGIWERVV